MIRNLAKVREAARQFHIDHVGNYDIAVDAATLISAAVPKPWYTLSQCGGRRTDETLPFELPAGSRLSSGGPLRVFVIEAGLCLGITSIDKRRLANDEALRFVVAIAGYNLAPGCRLGGEDGTLADWAWGAVNGGKRVNVTRHNVFDANLAHEREADVRAAVAAGKYPVLLSVGKKRAVGFSVIERPVV